MPRARIGAERAVSARELREIHNCSEGTRIQTGAPHKRAVELFLRHQPVYIVGLNAAAVKDAQRGGVFSRILSGGAATNQPVSGRSNFWGRHATRSNRP